MNTPSDRLVHGNGPIRRVRSFVLRQGRMSDSTKDALERLSDDFVIPFSDQPLDIPKLFPHTGRVIAEIGFGMGEATIGIARDRPDLGILGIEVHLPGVARLLREMERQDVPNIRIIRCDAAEVFRTMIPDASLEGIHIFFPDPWPKKRHHKRRLIRKPFPELLARKLRPGGYLCAATDWEEYAVQILREFEDVPGLMNPHGGYAPRGPWRPVTSFERKGIAGARLIRDILVRKTGGDV